MSPNRRSKNFDFSEYILNVPNTKLGDKKGPDFDVELIEKHEGEVEFTKGSVKNAYAALYFQIRDSFGFVDTYNKLSFDITEDRLGGWGH